MNCNVIAWQTAASLTIEIGPTRSSIAAQEAGKSSRMGRSFVEGVQLTVSFFIDFLNCS